ncbi:MAG: XRE family transcriptional regulator, partial [Oscillospiraceae bacterium]
MIYELRHKDTQLIRFSATENSNEPDITILWQNNDMQNLFPLDLNVSEDGIAKWLKHRTIPKNRAYVHAFLSKCGMNINRPMNIIRLSKGLSLNDCYWVVEEGFAGEYSKYNLYENNFSQVLAVIAFTGYGSSV